MFRNSILIFSLLFLASCMKQGESGTAYQVDPVLSPYVESFIAEAAKRGHIIEKKNLIAQFNKASDGLLCGSCNSVSSEPGIQKIVSIYNVNPCWFNDQELETLIFHELGHCILGRVHKPDTLVNGDPSSIMVPNNLALYSPCSYPIGNQPCDMSFKREYYINELFDPNTSAPTWIR